MIEEGEGGGGTDQDAQAMGTCRPIGHQYLIDEPGCDLFAVNINICSGTCLSLSFVQPLLDNTNIGKEAEVRVFAQCCRMESGIKLNVSIPCGDGPPRTVHIPSATKCSCFDCSGRRRRRRG